MGYAARHVAAAKDVLISERAGCALPFREGNPDTAAAPGASSVAIGGVGYVGLAYSVAFAALGHQVVALDTNATKIFSLAQGRSPIFEPGINVLLRQGLEHDRLHFTNNDADAIPDADFAPICVGTPANTSGRVDTGYIVEAVRG